MVGPGEEEEEEETITLAFLLYFQTGPVPRTELWHPVTDVRWEVVNGDLVKHEAYISLRYKF